MAFMLGWKDAKPSSDIRPLMPLAFMKSRAWSETQWSFGRTSRIWLDSFPTVSLSVFASWPGGNDGGEDGGNDGMWLLSCKFIIDAFELWAFHACNYDRMIMGTKGNETKQLLKRLENISKTVNWNRKTAPFGRLSRARMLAKIRMGEWMWMRSFGGCIRTIKSLRSIGDWDLLL